MSDPIFQRLASEHGYDATKVELMLEEKKIAILMHLYKLTNDLKELIPHKMGQDELVKAKGTIRELIRIISDTQVPDFKKIFRQKSEAFIKTKEPKLAEERKLIIALIEVIEKQPALLKGLEHSLDNNNFKEMQRIWDVLRFTMKREADIINEIAQDEQILKSHMRSIEAHKESFSQVNRNF